MIFTPNLRIVHMIRTRPTPWLHRCGVALLVLIGLVLGSVPQVMGQTLRDSLHHEVLDNGLEVMVLPDHSVPITTIELTVRHGAFAESPEFDGLAHLYEHMFFKGNEVIPNQEAYMDRIRELGMVFNGTTSTERVNYFFTLPAENLSEGLEFMYHATVSPLFDEDEFEREKSVVFGEADRSESSPYHWLRKSVREMLWYEHPHRKSPLGDMDAVADATVDQMRHIQEVYYVPNNSVLLIAGDVDIDQGMELARQHFGEWERGPDPFEVEPVPEHPPLDETRVSIVKEDVQIPTFQIAWQGPNVDDDPQATHAADVLTYILDQPGSAFQQRLVDSGIALNASKSYVTQRHGGQSTATVRARPDTLRDALRVTLEEINRLGDPDYFSDEQLEAAKTILEVNEIYRRENTSSFSRILTFWWAVSGLDYYLDYIDDLHAVTGEDIARYVDDYLRDQPFALGLLISEEHREQLGLTEEELQELIEDIQRDIDAEETVTQAAEEL